MAEDDPRSGMQRRTPIVSRSIDHNEIAFYEDDSRDKDLDDGGFDLSTIWRIAWSRRYWIFGTGVLGFAIALIYSLLQTPLYRSTAVLELNPPTVPILSGNSSSDDGLVVPQMDWQFLATQYGLLKSRELAERVVEDLRLANSDDARLKDLDPKQRVQALAAGIHAGLDIKPIPDSRLVELNYSSPTPADAARIVNGFAEAFLSASMDRRYEATKTARDFLEKRLKIARAGVNDAERELVAYAQKNNLIITSKEGTESNSLTGASLESLNAALAVAQQKRIAAEQRYRQAGSITEVTQSTSALRQEKAKLETEYREKSTYLQDEFPEMVRLRSRIDALSREISKEAGNASGSLRAEYQAALAEENSLKAKVGQLSSNVMDERERSIQYNILQRELDTKRSLYDTLLERYNEIGVASGIGSAQAAIVDRGERPGAPYSPNVIRNIILGLFLGLGFGAACAFAYEMIVDTIRTPDDMREKLRITLLGVIPKKVGKNSLSDQVEDDRSAIVESYNTLVATLQFSTSEGLPRTILVTSAMPAEGKSTSSFMLATVLARRGQRVLLLDADMRKPSFFTQKRSEAGLSFLLAGKDEIHAHILTTPDPNLYLLPSGPIPPNPPHLLSTPRMASVLNELANQFDVVIIDAPPVHGFADAPIIASLCDGVVFIVESGRTRRRAALESISRLKGTHAAVLGGVLTKYSAPFGEYEYTYHYFDEYNSYIDSAKPHELAHKLRDNGE